MPPSLVPDEVVDSLQPRADVDGPGFLTTIEPGPDGRAVPRPLRALCSIGSWDDALVLARGAADRVGTSTDHQGFGFLDEATVVVVDPLDDSVLVSGPAFTRLMARLLGTLVAQVFERGGPVMGEEWWSELVVQQDRLGVEAELTGG